MIRFGAILAILIGTALGASAAPGIPDRIGAWRVEVGPAGNDVYEKTPDPAGKSDEIKRPPKTPRDPAEEARSIELLARHADRFQIAKQLARLGPGPKTPDGRFRFVVMGDSRSHFGLWQSMVQHIDSLDPKPAFILNTGDLVYGGRAAAFLDYLVPPLLKTEIPFFPAVGNHDIGIGSSGAPLTTLFGEEVFHYGFDYGKSRFILFDNVTNRMTDKEKLKWLDRALAETPAGFRKYVAVHEPPSVVKKWAWHAWDTTSSKAFVDLMARHAVDHVFLGHVHAYSTEEIQGVKYTVTGGGGAPLHRRYGPKGAQYHYVLCDAEPGAAAVQRVVSFIPAGPAPAKTAEPGSDEP
jgi:hypothetical protein